MWKRSGKNMEESRKVPFDSDRKLMSTVHETSEGVIMFVKGAVDVLSGRMCKVRRNGEEEPITDEDRKALASVQSGFLQTGT